MIFNCVWLLFEVIDFVVDLWLVFVYLCKCVFWLYIDDVWVLQWGGYLGLDGV